MYLSDTIWTIFHSDLENYSLSPDRCSILFNVHNAFFVNSTAIFDSSFVVEKTYDLDSWDGKIGVGRDYVTSDISFVSSFQYSDSNVTRLDFTYIPDNYVEGKGKNISLHNKIEDSLKISVIFVFEK